MIILEHGFLAIDRREKKKATDLLFLGRREKRIHRSLKAEKESKRTLLEPLPLEMIELDH